MTTIAAAPSLHLDPPLHRSHERSIVDGIRFGAGLSLVALGIGVARLLDSTLLGLADDLTAATNGLPSWVRDLAGVTTATAVVGAGTLLVFGSLLTTRFRRLALFTVGMALAAGLSTLMGHYLATVVDASVRNGLAVDVPIFRIAGAEGRLNPADPSLAAAIAAVTIGGTFLSRAAIRWGGILIVSYAIASVVTTGAPPVALLTDFGIGLAVGSGLLWLFGRHDVSLDAHDVLGALRSAGIDAASIARAPIETGTGWLAIQPDGGRLFVVPFSRDDRSADLLVRAIRWLRFRGTGDHRPFLSLQRAVEHEALVWQQAAVRGVAAPRVVAVGPAGLDGMVLARDWIDGTAALDLPHLTDRTVRTLWADVARLQEARIAHGALNLTHVLVDDHGQPWLTHYHRSELAASDHRLNADVAELLASTAAAFGCDRAVRLAHQTIGTLVLERSLPLIQPLALTSLTRLALQDAEGFDALRNQVAATCEIPVEEPVPLQRVAGRTLFMLATLVLSAWFLVPQLADLGSIWSQAKDASWPWALAAVAFSIGSYAAATGSLLGAIPTRLAFGPAFLAQIASSFANRVTPVKVGGVAINVRYFQRAGVPVAVSATAVGLNAIAGVFMHLVLTLGFLLLANGDDRSGGIDLPSTGAITLVAATIALMAGLATFVPLTRELIVTHVLPQLRSGWEALQTIIGEPARLVLLLGCSALITLSYLAAMVASLEALGSDASLVLVALLFMTGSAVANTAPTPGGLGATEAALIAALSTVESASIVVPAVFLYRLVTFWLPILPGWLALNYLRSTDRL